MTESFTIPYPLTKAGKSAWSRMYSLNAIYAGKHWSQRRKDAEYWHMQTLSAMQKAGCRREPLTKPVIIRFTFGDGLDCSNHAYMVKMIEDAMKGKIIKDDSPKWVVGNEIYFHDEDCIRVEVREADDDRT